MLGSGQADLLSNAPLLVRLLGVAVVVGQLGRTGSAFFVRWWFGHVVEMASAGGVPSRLSSKQVDR